MYIEEAALFSLVGRFLGPSASSILFQCGFGPVDGGGAIPEGCIEFSGREQDTLMRHLQNMVDPGTAMQIMFGIEMLTSR